MTGVQTCALPICSGAKVEEVKKLLKSFDMMQALIKQMNGAAGKKRKKRGFGGMPGMGGLPGMGGMGFPKF